MENAISGRILDLGVIRKKMQSLIGYFMGLLSAMEFL